MGSLVVEFSGFLWHRSKVNLLVAARIVLFVINELTSQLSLIFLTFLQVPGTDISSVCSGDASPVIAVPDTCSFCECLPKLPHQNIGAEPFLWFINHFLFQDKCLLKFSRKKMPLLRISVGRKENTNYCFRTVVFDLFKYTPFSAPGSARWVTCPWWMRKRIVSSPPFLKVI